MAGRHLMVGDSGKGTLTGGAEPPGFLDMVRVHGPITLGAARAYARKLDPAQQRHPCCACYKCVCPSNGCCCPGACVGLSCNVAFGGCLWYSCSDLKGNEYNVVKVDAEKGTWAFFSENRAVGTYKGDNLQVGCYCE